MLGEHGYCHTMQQQRTTAANVPHENDAHEMVRSQGASLLLEGERVEAAEAWCGSVVVWILLSSLLHCHQEWAESKGQNAGVRSLVRMPVWRAGSGYL
jgi:hypothetical protein